MVAVGGAALGALAFFALPFITFGFLGSITAAQATGARGSSGLLWLVPLCAVIGGAFAVAALATSGYQPSRGKGALLIALGFIPAAFLLLIYVGGSQYSGFIGSGLWVMLLGMLALAVGGIVDVVKAGRP